jgi:SAM-dependent methyltransferase
MLRRRVASVVAIDPDEPSIAEARSYGDDIDYLIGELERVELPRASFDAVTAVAMLHHVDHRAGLRLLSDLVAPGGVLLIVGLARSQSLGDYARDARDTVACRRHTLTKGVWQTPAPKIWPPPLSYAGARAASLEVLPNADVRRVPYFRYALKWVRCDDTEEGPTDPPTE